MRPYPEAAKGRRGAPLLNCSVLVLNVSSCAAEIGENGAVSNVVAAVSRFSAPADKVAEVIKVKALLACAIKLNFNNEEVDLVCTVGLAFAVFVVAVVDVVDAVTDAEVGGCGECGGALDHCLLRSLWLGRFPVHALLIL